SGMDSGWCDDWSNRGAEARSSTPLMVRFGPSKYLLRASQLTETGAMSRATVEVIEQGSRLPKLYDHENHSSAAQLYPFSNHGAAVPDMRQADEVDPDRTKRS